MMRRRDFLVLAGAAALRAQSSESTIYAGTYTRGKSKGIYSFRYRAGALSGMQLAAETENPSFLALHPNRRFLYAVNENTSGEVSAFAIEAPGKLRALNRVSSHGSGPCHLVVHPNGKCLCVANYNSGSTAVFPVHADGSLGEASDFVAHTGSGPNQARQSSPHAHETVLSPDGRFLFVPDLGADQVVIYRLDADRGKLSDRRVAKTPPGFGPRHMAFHPNGRFAYVLGELGGAVIAMRYVMGMLTELQTISTLPEGFKGANGSAEIQIHPNGHFLYASNRGPDTIATFRIDSAGKLTALGETPTGGKTPRNFVLDANAKFLLAENQDSDSIVSFAIGADGALKATGQTAACVSPVCLVFG